MKNKNVINNTDNDAPAKPFLSFICDVKQEEKPEGACYCEHCGRSVVTVESAADYHREAQAGSCVAISPGALAELYGSDAVPLKDYTISKGYPKTNLLTA